MIALGEINSAAAEVPFFLPLSTDPINSGLTGHNFTNNASTGEVQIQLPGGSFFNVPGSQIVEKGFGRYCVRLLPSQCLVAGLVYVIAIVANAQPYNGTETIGTAGGDMAPGTTGSIVFFLPNPTNPVFGTPVNNWTFTAGQVQLCLPGGSYANANLANVSFIGNGAYALALSPTDSVNRGKAFLYVNIGPTNSQRFETYITILNPGTGFGVVSLGDSYTWTDSLTPSADYKAAIADTVTTSDAMTASAGLQVPLGDTFPWTDGMTQLAGYLTAVSDSVAWTDALTLSADYRTAIADTFSFSDSLGVTAQLKTVISEIWAMQEGWTIQANLHSAISDTMQLLDSLLVAMQANIAIADTMTLSDAIQVQLSGVIHLGDSITWTDFLGATCNAIVALGDTVPFSDALAASLGIIEHISDTYTMSDSIAVVAAYTQKLRELVGWSDAVSISLPSVVPDLTGELVGVDDLAGTLEDE